MAIVKRGADGKIEAIYEERRGGNAEVVPDDDPDVLLYLAETGQTQELRERLTALDPAMARVTEDLVELLMTKNVIMLTDLPEAAREKLLERRSLRDKMSSFIGLVDDDGVI